MQKIADEKCKFEKGKNDDCRKMELKNASFRKAKITVAKQMKTTWKEAQVTNGEQLERTRANWKKTHITCGKTLQKMQPGKREHATCSTIETTNQLGQDSKSLRRRLGKHEILKGNEQYQQELRSM